MASLKPGPHPASPPLPPPPSNSKRSKSDPPPITVEDTTTGAVPRRESVRPEDSGPSATSASASASTTGFRSNFQFPQEHAQGPPDSDPANLRARRTSTWHRRRHSPGIEWKEKWTQDSWKNGRVLLIDYVAREHTQNGRRKIVAQEFGDVDGLRRFYANQDLSHQAALRVIHVQNASWATRFLLRKFNIDHHDDLVGTTFGRWAKYERPQRRGGKPVLNGKTFRTQRDPWRGISRAAFGLDYLRHYDKGRFNKNAALMKFQELNHYDSFDAPAYGYDSFVQRLSVYIQRSEGEAALPMDPDIRNPYNENEVKEYQRLRRQYSNEKGTNGHDNYIPRLQSLDNGSTIIIFEHSQSGCVEDTLIGARQEIESRWRRLTFYLPREEISNDERLALECMDFILRDIFKALAFSWEKYLNICETHTSILEDKIYENPADESRAPELWTNSSLWLKVERLMYIHVNIIKEMKNHLKELADEDPPQQETWLENTADEFDKLSNLIEEGIVKPTNNLSDLMYKSVGIRDARHSLQLGTSMWRLSWITFIFLPLTFVVGFFGMNVDTFSNDPSIKWFFISAFPLMITVLICWYGIKHTLASQRQDPLRRGVYETLFQELSANHPSLWSRRGPRTDLVPVGWLSSIRWRLVTSWFAPERTIAAKGYDPANEELGVWSRVKRFLVRQWLGRIQFMPATHASASAPDLESAAFDADLGAVGELLSLATPVAMAEVDPGAATRIGRSIPLKRLRSLSPTRSDDGIRSGSGSGSGRPASFGRSASGGGASGVMVDERGLSEDERSDASGGEEEPRRRQFMQRLTVPFGASTTAGGL
ncbi:uncharacterized protein BDZ99DRAFT_61992 [Mytilinidion resinicola]|uniref:Cora-domain-containing protein n=1 Tax=Mytilinidion resinicola TaxID=574789 RepID=A0A6A6YFX3_9PEZI|nr:uncharacterized protein BDZ99DRAFT_61992 [Mytilinidion resinicola]KAF2807640.1 hypothetical protein BDZ99DRAFT_61992 [Mytilinidion resinicola]